MPASWSLPVPSGVTPASPGDHPTAEARVTRAGDRVFSVDGVLAQEIRVAELAETGRGAGVGIAAPEAVHRAISAHDDAYPGSRLGADQREAVATITGDGQRLSILIGPAGTGKSVTLGVARAAWEASGHRVRGYAPFGAAAASLEESASIESDVVAKLLFEQRRLDQLRPEDRDRWEITSRDIVVVDEAGTIGTADLDRLLNAVHAAGAKLVLAGDHRQLASVARGGMFAELHRRLGGAELSDVHRLAQPWERDAAMAIRRRDITGLDAYVAHGRIKSGDRSSAIEAAYSFWADGYLSGHDTLIVARTNEVVDELNRRAQQLLVSVGRIDPGGAAIAGGAVANVGDIIITRRPNRRIEVTGPARYVRNGARWRVLAVSEHGDLVAEELAQPRRRAPGRVRLPADYAMEHVRLGYAGTGHSSQGKTVDRVGVVIDGSEDANWLYSALTRGRQGATIFVANEASELAAEFGKTAPTPREVLEHVVRRDGEKLAAVVELAAAQQRSEDVGDLEILAAAGRPTGELFRERIQLKGHLLRTPADRNLLRARADRSRATESLRRAEERLTSAVQRLGDVEAVPRWRRTREQVVAARRAVSHATEAKRAAARVLGEERLRVLAAEADVRDVAPRRDRLTLVESALELQVRRAVDAPGSHLVVALGCRPHMESADRDAWNQRALRLETYRRFELGLGRDDGVLGTEGIEAAIGRRPTDYLGKMQWDHAVQVPDHARGVSRVIEPLGLDL